jgi:hypothetical protein
MENRQRGEQPCLEESEGHAARQPSVVQRGKCNVMKKQERANCIDFIEFPAKEVGCLTKAKDFYKQVAAVFISWTQPGMSWQYGLIMDE